MNIEVFRLNAFSARPEGGNPAGVAPLHDWIDERQMQAIASEVGLSETAFIVREGDGFRIRWFTPVQEVPLCGHATLASAAVILGELEWQDWPVTLESASGPLKVDRSGARFVLDFPADDPRPAVAPAGLDAALQCETESYFQATNFHMLLVADERQLAGIGPDFPRLGDLIEYGLIVTAPGDDVDFVSRMFAPALGIDEDPVTGSAHCVLAPFWAARLGRNDLSARQISSRGGELSCEVRDDRVHLTGEVVAISGDVITVPDFPGTV